MAARDILKTLLEREWTPDIPDRDETVDEPRIEKSKDLKRTGLEEGALIIVKDGGATNVEPSSLGWDHERVETLLTLDIRTTDENGGHEQVYGVYDEDTLETENYGGLVGEVKRILDTYRRGVGDWCTVEGYEIDDISDEQGFGRYRVEFQVRLRTGPEVIDPPESDSA